MAMCSTGWNRIEWNRIYTPPFVQSQSIGKEKGYQVDLTVSQLSNDDPVQMESSLFPRLACSSSSGCRSVILALFRTRTNSGMAI